MKLINKSCYYIEIWLLQWVDHGRKLLVCQLPGWYHQVSILCEAFDKEKDYKRNDF